MTPRSDYEAFESSSPENRRLLRQEELIIDVAETLWRALEREGTTRAALAGRLDKSPGFVTQILSGDRNLTLRTLADVADALDSTVRIRICPNFERSLGITSLSVVQATARPPQLAFSPEEKRPSAPPVTPGLAMAS